MTELEENKPRGGSTALCAVFYNKELYVANVGDSQAVLYQQNGYVQLSNIHDLKNEKESTKVEEKGGTILNNRLEGEIQLTRSIGDIKYKKYMSSEPDVIHHTLTEYDELLILGTDGYWNGLGPGQTLNSI
mmetsp:Transcript_3979/g.3398  ORF Transcript_3979/g.3398 Transcript_3979/m.3398 type:complete len:131 (+) Transcript_3979:555-947(+)